MQKKLYLQLEMIDLENFLRKFWKKSLMKAIYEFRFI